MIQSATRHSSSINVLFVDDEVDFLASISKAIARRGFRVFTAAGVEEARLLFRANRIDVAVLDVRMPDGDGHELFYEMKSWQPSTQIIMLTGHGDIQRACELGAQGVFDYLSKPCDPDLLSRRIQDAAGLQDAIAPGTANPTPVSPKDVRVLVVDDEVDFLDVTKRLLVRRGFNVEAAWSGEMAIELVRTRGADVAILDLKMPGMNGLDLLHEIKQMDPKIEAIMLTGHATVDAALDCMKDGAFDYLLKPHSPDELAEKILIAAEHRQVR